ncbi:MAG: EF2563 family selenium-dependent molybdenum hydroxylase system protein [Deltaproteobacteria bacterium]|nr:EF2563 family selenium-dependent molybdenum hydroxylase system protein [Deltaproteobacteria bacterium]
MPLPRLTVLIRGAGEMASGVAWRLHQAHFRVLLTEVPEPLAVRREVSFCEAVYDGRKTVEGVEAVLIPAPEEAAAVWETNRLPLLVDPDLTRARALNPDALVDAILAKKNLGTRISDAPWVIGLGPGFRAGRDCHLVVETNRGHNLGRLYTAGEAEPDTGEPGIIGGFSRERVLRAPVAGRLQSLKSIGEAVEAGEVVAFVSGRPVPSPIKGILRGLIRDQTPVTAQLKIGDVDPRGNRAYCFTISEKARAIAGAILEGLLRRFHQ